MKPAVLILGATGTIGRGVVAAAAESGQPVIAVARDRDALEQLKLNLPDADLTIVPGSVANDADSEQLAKTLRELRRPLTGIVVALSGGTGRGRLLDHSIDVLQRRLDEDLLPHLAAARYLLPVLAESERGGGYVLIGGPGSELPWAGYGHHSVAAAALRMLAGVLHDEARALGVRVQLLAVDTPVRSERNHAHACPQWPSAVAIGRCALDLAEPGDRREPARAIVSCSTRKRPRGSVATPPAAPPEIPADDPNSQFADSDASLLPTRCLQDARTLLATLMSSKLKQEPTR